MGESFDISVIICTHNRAESLKETLDCLARAPADGLRIDVIVVGNNCTDNTAAITAEFEDRLSIRYLVEPQQGKSYALNRGLEAGGLGRIVAFLDDDMSPHQDYFTGINEACERFPNDQMFTGRTYVIFPRDDLPAWVNHGYMRVLFSVVDEFKDRPYRPGEWPLAGNFWIRREVLDSGIRFDHRWLTEPMFGLRLREHGYSGVFTVAATAGHRIQPGLLCERTLFERVCRGSRLVAAVQLPHYKTVRIAKMLKDHPLITRLFCAMRVVRWTVGYLLSWLHWSHAKRFPERLLALRHLLYNLEVLRIAGQIEAERKASSADS